MVLLFIGVRELVHGVTGITDGTAEVVLVSEDGLDAVEAKAIKCEIEFGEHEMAGLLIPA
eukprot:13059697-Ditylum_brightwellii.AAC.1